MENGDGPPDPCKIGRAEVNHRAGPWGFLAQQPFGFGHRLELTEGDFAG